ncbi:STAS domain-containing protein [Kitasatospora herbaricolor]|uniref:STAS domain-containing protein n=1 Tax=Kitasatospora herbaricolor TaxID=68217 RepID=UPI0036DB6254
MPNTLPAPARSTAPLHPRHAAPAPIGDPERQEARDHRARLQCDRPRHPRRPGCRGRWRTDFDGAPILHTALHRALAMRRGFSKLVIDLAAITFYDSTCIDALLLALNEADRQGVTFTWPAPPTPWPGCWRSPAPTR